MLNYLNQLWHILSTLVNIYIKENCSRIAASLAYSTLLAMVPLMLVSLSLASHVPTFSQRVSELQQFILHAFVTTATGSLTQYMQDFIDQVNRLSWTNLVAFTATGLLLLYNMIIAFNNIWHIRIVWHRQFTLSFILNFMLLLLAPLLLAVLMLVISYIVSLSWFSNDHFHEVIVSPTILISPYIAAFITFSFFNWVLPTCRVSIRYAMISGLFSTLLFELTKYLFAWYILKFPTYRLIYGALATIPIFFIWVYLSWVIILLGAILCQQLHLRSNRWSTCPDL